MLRPAWLDAYRHSIVSISDKMTIGVCWRVSRSEVVWKKATRQLLERLEGASSTPAARHVVNILAWISSLAFWARQPLVRGLLGDELAKKVTTCQDVDV